jgi:hypothetical protein
MRAPTADISSTSLLPWLDCESPPGARTEALHPKPSEGLPRLASQRQLAIARDVLASPGRALDAANRAFFERRFGYNFSPVHIHADDRAATPRRPCARGPIPSPTRASSAPTDTRLRLSKPSCYAPTSWRMSRSRARHWPRSVRSRTSLSPPSSGTWSFQQPRASCLSSERSR